MSSRDIIFSAAGAGGGDVNYIDDVFSTYLYTGNDGTTTINNGIDLAGEGGLVWIKSRTNAAGSPFNHQLVDTVRGRFAGLQSNLTNQENGNGLVGGNFLSNGFSVVAGQENINNSGNTYCSWTFREQAKFFDVVTWTGDDNTSRTIPHILDSQPGFIIIKCTSFADNWTTFARINSTQYSNIKLNTTAAQVNAQTQSNIASTTALNVGWIDSNLVTVNATGRTYVAYLFAHDAGGFGAAGTDNVISCGTFTGNTTVNLGYEPQWILLKQTNGADNWYIHDNMRGWPVSGDAQVLYPNLSSAEGSTSQIYPNATGFSTLIGSGTYIYMTIRRPMKPPTSGTQVFSTDITASSSTSSTPTYSSGFVTDMGIEALRTGSSFNFLTSDRLRGQQALYTNRTNAEASNSNVKFDYMNGWGGWSSRSSDYMSWMFRRAPTFFDEVCYTGTGVARTITHNLTVAPELMIVKSRSATQNWIVYTSSTGAGNYGVLNDLAAFTSTGAAIWNSLAPTSTVFSLGTSATVNGSGNTYVAYLFASCPGVSKIGFYSGTSATQTINCGFTGGARFVLIKHATNVGNWYVWDTARGMVSGTNPSLALDTTAAEINANSVYTVSTGFQIVSTAGAINASGSSYIFLAIA